MVSKCSGFKCCSVSATSYPRRSPARKRGTARGSVLHTDTSRTHLTVATFHVLEAPSSVVGLFFCMHKAAPMS